MSRAMVCDHCGTTLVLNSRGEADSGEDSAWIRLTITGQTFDLCTRSCVAEFLERPEVAEGHEAHIESITSIARVIHGADDEGDEDDD